MKIHTVGGPFFEDFEVGQIFGAPATTVTDGIASIYQAIIGDRLRLPLSNALSEKVTGHPKGLVHPMLTINIVNGQTTFASQNVKGNLFYRGLILKNPVFIGDTLSTTTKVVGLKQNRVKEGREATGMVALEIETINQDAELVVKYWRCPMIACRNTKAETGRNDSFDWIPEHITDKEIITSLPDWNVGALLEDDIHLPNTVYAEQDEIIIEAQDSVTNAPELVRLTGNIAYAHTDATKSYLRQRLVYGGHTISLAFAQIVRAFPNAIGLVAWQKCNHLAPVLEEDIISSKLKIHRKLPIKHRGHLYELSVSSTAKRSKDDGTYAQTEVLSWDLILWSH